MTPFVLMADIDKAVIDVTTLVARINSSPWPGIKIHAHINLFYCKQLCMSVRVNNTNQNGPLS